MSCSIILQNAAGECLSIGGGSKVLLGLLSFIGEDWKVTTVSYSLSFPEDTEDGSVEELKNVIDARKFVKEKG